MGIISFSDQIIDRDGLFKAVLERVPDLEYIANTDQVRNVVNKAKYRGIEVFVKVGLKQNLSNLIEFYSKELYFESFTIPKLITSGAFIYQDMEIIFLIEEKVDGIPFSSSRNFSMLNSAIANIVLEMDKLPNLGLTVSEEKRKLLLTEDGINKYKSKLQNLLTEWYQQATIKYSKLLHEANAIVNSDIVLEMGSAHGELNYHHIFLNNAGKVSIIDWERFSQVTIRFFDLLEYLGRLLVFEADFDSVENIMNNFKKRTNFDNRIFEFGLYHRILGSLYEASVANVKTKIDESDEEKLFSFVKSLTRP